MFYWKNHHNIRCSHPILQNRAVLKILSTGPVCQSGECNSGPGFVLRDVGVQAQGLLLVGPVDVDPVVAVPDLPALSRVILEWLPRLAVVHGFVNSQGVGLLVAKLQGDVGKLVLLPQGQGEGDVALLVGREELTVPARHIIRIIQIGQI